MGTWILFSIFIFSKVSKSISQHLTSKAPSLVSPFEVQVTSDPLLPSRKTWRLWRLLHPRKSTGDKSLSIFLSIDQYLNLQDSRPFHLESWTTLDLRSEYSSGPGLSVFTSSEGLVDGLWTLTPKTPSRRVGGPTEKYKEWGLKGVPNIGVILERLPLLRNHGTLAVFPGQKCLRPKVGVRVKEKGVW